jgi:hypothetical protein
MRRWIRNCAEAGKGVIRVEIDVEEMKRLRKADTAPYEDEGVPPTLPADGPKVRIRAPLAKT